MTCKGLLLAVLLLGAATPAAKAGDPLDDITEMTDELQRQAMDMLRQNRALHEHWQQKIALAHPENLRYCQKVA
jgi:hypothetical protein